MTPGETAPKRLISTENGVNKHSRPGERNDHQALTHQTTLPPGRETNGKPAPGPRAIPRNLPQAWLHALAERPEPETSTPGTSKRPRVAQEGKRRDSNRHQVNVPKNVWNGICFSGQRPSTGTGKVIQRLKREKRKKIE